jgi:hypothetical protein
MDTLWLAVEVIVGFLAPVVRSEPDLPVEQIIVAVTIIRLKNGGRDCDTQNKNYGGHGMSLGLIGAVSLRKYELPLCTRISKKQLM